ncbi:MAG: hypothetical protein NT062_08655 [Proteobacteria bacterium]|nr:hypothetical protein [Pseudomonadota bacterium]
MNASRLVSLVVAGVLAALPSAHADPRDDFALQVKESTGDYYTAYVLTKLVTFKVGAKCWQRILDKSTSEAVHTASFITRDLAAYAKQLTNDDWSAIETAGNNDHEANKAAVEKLVTAFQSRLSITIAVEGDDCDAKTSSLWLKYWSVITGAVKNFSPAAGKAFISLEVTGKARDVTSSVSADGTTYKFTAPRDIEAAAYDIKLVKPFKKRTPYNPMSTDVDSPINDFVFELKEQIGGYARPWVIAKFVTFKVGTKCSAKLADKNANALHMASFYVSDIAELAKSVTKDDWLHVETQSSDVEANKKFVEKMMDDFKPRHHVTVTIPGDDCDVGSDSLWLRYWGTVGSALRDYPPKSGKSFVNLNLVAKGKDLTTATKGDTITITAPINVEPSAWDDKIKAPFKKLSKSPK